MNFANLMQGMGPNLLDAVGQAVLRGRDGENRFGLQHPLFGHRAKWRHRAK